MLTARLRHPQVYAVALFVEADKAAKELGVRERGVSPADRI